eukprot:gnl/TRDRNA2_/TRDRNA2_88942_c0_seq1.p1 gnl/TRDRNA2_/TRDRNA2_88942_c0~~gnl/TRDRNA2_/TRDRNA2_88942_c0_seq1.p1  ORF type:complete len:725 (-),score=158.82 gnl/TRDRNA2_/TRDRNA2_88942_c0_seq1:198-2204(-)
MVEDREAEHRKLKDDLRKLGYDLQEHTNQCKSDMSSIKDKLTELETDKDNAAHALSLSPCQGTTSLLACKRSVSKKSPPFILFGHTTLRKMMTKLTSETARQALQRALLRVSKQGTPAGTRMVSPSLLQEAHRHRHRKGLQRSRSDLSSRCQVVRLRSCEGIEEAMLGMYSHLEDKQDDLDDEFLATETDCATVEKDYTFQISQTNTRAGRMEGALAEAMAATDTAHAAVKEKKDGLELLDKEMPKTRAQCVETIKSLEDKECSLKKMRGELFVVDGAKRAPVIQDCEVSPWVAGACSQYCGGGTQTLTRRVITPAGKSGMACLPLEMKRACNEQPCPKDCKVSSWGQWSECSSVCGGGMRSRNRKVLVQAAHGGEPCPEENSIGEQCNNHPCDVDCKLSEWSAWGSCSRACDGGFMPRTMEVIAPAQGSGHCPSEEERTQYLACNKEPCVSASKDEPIKCNSNLDVVLILDGSGFVGEEGFESVKKFASMLIKSLGVAKDKTSVAVALTSGPKTWNAYKKCEQGGKAAPTECNVKLSLALTDDAAGAAGAVDSLSWPGAPSYTSGALSVAANALQSGRAQAESIVLVVAAGPPLSFKRTLMESQRLRKRARLMWVLVGNEGVPVKKAVKWASRPARDNVFEVGRFKALEEASKVSEVVSAMCPTVAK